MELLYLCVKIFCGRLIDVTLSTLQTMLLVKGKRNLATIIGFIDVFIWFIVVREALNTDIKSIWIALSYAGGYAAGTFTGSNLAKRVISGTVGVQVITKNKDNKVISAIKASGFSATYVECKGIHEEDTSYLIGAQVDNKKLDEFKALVTNVDKNAFITVTESKENLNGYFGK
ncbi:MAG: DUF2179 domain-containing protein [Bacilli bacterium]|nr:DUF2179 domain-containing protein [Bacilli bacterium]MBO6194790.1 DUF2179 domain-containing protein [Bacilli bacterium]